MTSPTNSTAPFGDTAGIFGRAYEPDQPAAIIEREHLTAGAVVRHRGTRQVKTTNGSSTIHTFSLVGAPENTPWFSLWGSANLNSQLRKARAGAVLLLRYDGQATNEDGSPGAHQWTVQPSTVGDAQLRAYLGVPARVAAIRELATVVERALTNDRERRQAARGESPAGPSHDDDDLPF